MFKKFEWLKKSDVQRNIIFIILIFLTLNYIKQCEKSESDKLIFNQNISALSDSLRIVKTKTGELEFVKKLLITDANELKKLNDSLYRELIKEKGNVKYIIKERIIIKHDTIYVPTEVVINPINSEYQFSLLWNHEKNGSDWYRNIKGRSDFSWDTINNQPINPRTVITDDILKLHITTGFRFIDGYYESFARSTYPNILIDHTSAIIDKKMITGFQKRWHIGLVLNVGGSGYLNKPEIIPYFTYSVGVGIMWTPFNWLNF